MTTMTTERIPVLDLRAQYESIGAELEQVVLEVLRSGAYILGPHGRGLEAELAAFSGAPHAVGCASGTDALRLCLHALGLKPGDEVITTPFTFVATANTISRAGAIPVFVDIEPGSFNIDPARIAAAITPRTVGMVPVHLYGQPANMDAIMELARAAGLWVLEDCAQALGATWHDRPAGTIGAAGCISFYPTKNLGGAGDAGAIITQDPELARMVELLRRHGAQNKYDVDMVGWNSRLDEIQAAILRIKLRRLDTWIAERRRVAARYDALLAGTAVVTPPVSAGATHVYHQYTIRAPRRDQLADYLRGHGIDTMIYYPIPLHRQRIYANLGYGPGSLPESERAGLDVLSLPIYPELTDAQVERVAETIRAFYAR